MVITDGRSACLAKTIASLRATWPADVHIDKKILVVDKPSRDFHNEMKATYPDFHIVGSNRKLGFHGAIQLGWENLGDSQWIFHLEDDFDLSPCGTLPIEGMQMVMRNSSFAQVALKRQPWAEAEKLAGGIVEQWPDLYEDRNVMGHDVTVHKQFFTTNPSLYYMNIPRHGWPQCEGSEAEFTRRLLKENYEFAFWGKKFDPPRVTHIGNSRIGTGY